MKPYEWLSKRLISGVLLSVMLAVMTSAGLGTSPILATDGLPPEMEWDKTFGGSSYDHAYSVQQTTDGGYIMAGSTSSYGAGLSDVYLVKTDAAGAKEWDKTFGGSSYDHAYSVQQTTDGGYIMAGSTRLYPTYTYDADVYLIKTDASGAKEWDKTFGGSSGDWGYSVQQTADGGYIIGGCTIPLGLECGDFYLLKTDAAGNKEWDKTFGESNYHDDAYSVQQTTDGGYIMAGGTRSYDPIGMADVYLVKTDAAGAKEWDTTFGGSCYDHAYSVQQTTDGGYIMAGDTCSFGAGLNDVYLIKTDASGAKEWDTTFGGSHEDWAEAVRQTTDGGYIIGGCTDPYGTEWFDLYLVKTDASGNKEWDKTFGGSNDDIAYSIQQTTDGGCVMAGATDSFGAGLDDAYLVKVNPWINTPVGSNVTVTQESGTVTFPEVYESGITTMTTSTENPGGPTPSDYFVIGNFINITTTANCSGPVTIGIIYDEAQVEDEESLQIFHWNGSAWEDVTTSVDTVENIVYGQVASLSSFFLGEPAVLPVADAGGPYLAQVDCSVELDGSASYHPDGTIVDYDWSFGDNTTGTGVSVPHIYTAVGVYDVNLTVTDDRGAQSSDTTMVAVYDPSTGFVTGGGWIDSPEGAYTADPSLTGKANFGFVSKYKKGEGVPTGQTEFRFKIADLNFHSSSYDWLIVAGTRALFKGEGTINGSGSYKFKLTAIDAEVNTNDNFDIDRFRIKIWDESGGTEVVIYDNALGDDSDDATTEIGGGSIIIHEG